MVNFESCKVILIKEFKKLDLLYSVEFILARIPIKSLLDIQLTEK